jgi:hypothetical protein
MALKSGNYVMQINFFGNTVRCETDGYKISLTDLVIAGNCWRAQNGQSLYPLAKLIDTKGYREFLSATSEEWGIPIEELVVVEGRGRTARTMAHLSVAVFIAEQMSPQFHAKVIKEFAEGRLLEFRSLGGTEFKKLNVAIDTLLPERLGRDNVHVFVSVAEQIRSKILGAGAKTADWNSASSAQTSLRYDLEKYLVRSMQLGIIKTVDQLKDVIKNF